MDKKTIVGLTASILMFAILSGCISNQTGLATQDVSIIVMDDIPTIPNYQQIRGAPTVVYLYIYHQNDDMPGLSYFERIDSISLTQNPVNHYEYTGEKTIIGGEQALYAGYCFDNNFVDGHAIVKIVDGHAMVHHWRNLIAID